MSIWRELRRRSVFKVGGAYAVVAWLLIQVASILLPTFGAPVWVMPVFSALVILGFPLALVIAWVFDLTPEGLRRTLPESRELALHSTAVALVPNGEAPQLPALATAPKGSVAVLPFVDLSSQPDQEHLADGIAENLIDGLAKVKGLRVLARTSSFAVDNKEDIRVLGRQLGVSSILEGSIRRSGDLLRVTARLVDVRDGLHLWSDAYDRRMADMFTIQDDISRSIVNRLRLKLDMDARSPQAQVPTPNIDAYEWFLKGRRYWYRRYKVGLQTALGCFQKAIDLDPDFAAPYAGVANTFNSLGIFAFLDPKEALKKARAAAESALRLDPTMAAAHFAMGGIHFFFEWNLTAAQRELVETVTLDPTHGEAIAWLGMLAAVRGEPDEAIRHATKARDTEPDSPYLAFVEILIDIWCRRDRTILDALNKLLEQEPELPTALFVAGDLYSSLGDHENATSKLAKSMALTNRAPLFVAGLAAALARSGDTAGAEGLLAELNSRTEHEYVTPVAIAATRANLGDVEDALRYFQRAVDERSPSLLVTYLLPLWDCIRNDPRFDALLKSGQTSF